MVKASQKRKSLKLALYAPMVFLIAFGQVSFIGGVAEAATATRTGYGTAYCPSGYTATSGNYALPSNYYGSSTRTIYRLKSAGIRYGTQYRATATKTRGYKSGGVWRYSTSAYSPRVAVNCYKRIVVTRTGSGTAYCLSPTRAVSGGYTLPRNYYGSFSSTEYQIRSFGIRYGNQYHAKAVKINGSYSSSYGWRYSTFSYSPSVSVTCVG
jgi:hypothetical protein